jgi:endonuclease G
MVKPYFALAYNEPAGTPRWVSWRVTAADLEGSAPRKQLFDDDETLPMGYYRVTHKDYTGSGFDRGHLCPHADRDASKEMSWATFVMTNIVPQAPHVNQGAWADLEDYCRDLVRREHARLYVVAGPTGQGGRGSTGGVKETIAGGRVRVPAACWKVIVVVPAVAGASMDDLTNVGTATRVIAVIMPNDNAGIGRDWSKYRTSVAEVERQTGLHFFDRLPADVAEALRGKVDGVAIKAGR